MTNKFARRLAHIAFLSVSPAALALSAAPATAQSQARAFDIPAQPLGSAILEFSRQADVMVVLPPELAAGKRSAAVKGSLPVNVAIGQLLRSSGLRAVPNPTGGYRVGPFAERVSSLAGSGGARSASSRRGDMEASETGEIVVTGSRIKGSELASPTIRATREEIVSAGFADSGQFLRSIPQNFTGGQNPGVATGASAGGLANQNITGGSAVNLRGLGPDATLTLFNGNRIAFGGFAQGVDIASIPVAALDRIEIVPDGSSAIYGSDAVAGVVNIITRRPFDGLEVSSRLGTAIEGGYFNQQYSAVGGKTWASGGVMLAYNYQQNSDIQATDRSYTTALGEPYTLYRPQATHSVVAGMSQALFDGATFKFDGMYNHRRFTSAITSSGILLTGATTDESYSLAPSLRFETRSNWNFTVTGVYGRGENIGEQDQSRNGVNLFHSVACYCNSVRSLEAFVEGPLAQTAAGVVRLVAGGGHRSVFFDSRSLISGNGVKGHQNDGYAYAEISVPLISDRNASPLLRKLTFSAAGRYDKYNSFGSVGTPKLGAIYSPLNGLELKYSWGKSFKAPTLLQQLQQRSASLIDASTLIGNTAPAGATALYTEGGSSEIAPERATSSTWTATITPTAIPGLTLDLSYYDIHYKDRVAKPIGNYLASLGASYANHVVRAPTAGEVEAAIAASDTGLQYYTSLPYNRSTVAYIIDNHFTNVADQKISGFDLGASYRTPLGMGELITELRGSWIDSKQRNELSSPYFDLAGTVWNPPHWRARGNLGWSSDTFKALLFVNYLGGVTDQRQTPAVEGKEMVTVDLSLGYETGDRPGPFAKMKLGLTVENLFNKAPPYLKPTISAPQFDSTNYSAIGRYVSLYLSKSF